MNRTNISDARVQSAVAAIKGGDHDRARSLLQEAIVQDPENDRAWLWLAVVVDTLLEQRRCLYRALSIDPDNALALEALRRLYSEDARARLDRPASLLPGHSPPIASRPAVATEAAQGGEAAYTQLFRRVRGLWAQALTARASANATAANDLPDVRVAPAPASQHKAKRALKFAKYLFDGLLVLVVLGAVGLMLAPKLFSTSLMVVLSQSMEPNIPMGSIVVTRPTPPEEIEVGDVITFRSSDFGSASDLVTHRVVELVGSGAFMRFRTQGDAVEDPDPKLVDALDLVGRVWFSLPQAGYLVSMLRTPKGLLIFIGLPALLLISGEIIGALKGSEEPDRKPGAKVALGSGGEGR